ncbi:MAG: alpha/beta family hydrolase, partial [Gemmatimonadota bacterium]
MVPPDPSAVLVLAHGAGAGMTHPFMQALAAALARHAVATVRFQFPCPDRGGRRPDPPPVLLAAVEAAVVDAGRRFPRLSLFAGGKSMGGRMASQAASRGMQVQGLVFFGFPLHPAGQPGTTRAAHLERVKVPMLFLQGGRDKLADLGLLTPIVQGLGPAVGLEERLARAVREAAGAGEQARRDVIEAPRQDLIPREARRNVGREL